MAFLAFLAFFNPPKADGNPIAIPPSTPAPSSYQNSLNANGSLRYADAASATWRLVQSVAPTLK